MLLLTQQAYLSNAKRLDYAGGIAYLAGNNTCSMVTWQASLESS